MKCKKKINNKYHKVLYAKIKLQLTKLFKFNAVIILNEASGEAFLFKVFLPKSF